MRAGKFLIGCSALAGVSIAAFATAAHADVVISKKATVNMTCSGGVCSPTAKNAVLNATDLTNMLATGDVKVTSGSGATDIVMKDGFSWTSTSRLTLDARQSVEVDKPVTVAGAGAMTITTNDGGSGGEFIVLPEKGSVQFWDLSSNLVINGQSYTLVGDIKTLAADIAANPSGFYALAKDYDASADGTYTSPPVETQVAGTIEGLGHAFSKVSMNFETFNSDGFFKGIDPTGVLRDIGVANSKMEAFDFPAAGLLAGVNEGDISHCWASGSLHAFLGDEAGGLVGFNSGSIADSYANARVHGRQGAVGEAVGGLVGRTSDGTISQSYALGIVSFRGGDEPSVGGLIGENAGSVQNSFGRNTVSNSGGNSAPNFGGLVGKNDGSGQIVASYAAGTIIGGNGGLVGFDAAPAGNIGHTYWDVDMGIGDPHRGAGNVEDDPGIKGLTTAQLKAGLPRGFKSKMWGEDLKINDGYPFLLANPSK